MLGYDDIDKLLSLLLVEAILLMVQIMFLLALSQMEWFTEVISVTENRMAKDGHGQPEAVCQL